MAQNRGNWFSKATKLENVGPVPLVFEVKQRGINGTPLYQAGIDPGRYLEVFGSDIFRNHSREHPISAYVHVAGVDTGHPELWTQLEQYAFQNARLRLAGGDSVEIPVALEPFKGSKIGRLRVVVRLKQIMNKIRRVED